MHIAHLDLNLLRVLHAIHAERSVTGAALVLHLSQPAVSHALRRLRSALGDPLFVRQGAALVPTPYTRGVIAPVQTALRSLESSLTRSAEFAEATAQRRFVLGIHDALEMYALPKVVAHVSRSAPGIALASLPINGQTLEADLATGVLDAVVDFVRPLSKDLRTCVIARDQLVVLCRRGHPMLKAGAMKLKHYLAAEHVVVCAQRESVTIEDAELARRSLSRTVRARTQRYVSAMEIVSRSDLLLTMPGSYARVINVRQHNALLELPFSVPELDHHLYWHRYAEDDPASQWLRNRISQAFESLEPL